MCYSFKIFASLRLHAAQAPALRVREAFWDRISGVINLQNAKLERQKYTEYYKGCPE